MQIWVMLRVDDETTFSSGASVTLGRWNYDLLVDEDATRRRSQCCLRIMSIGGGKATQSKVK